MKTLIFLLGVFSFITSCGPTDVKVHVPAPGEAYCTYNATGGSPVPFPVCIYCPRGEAICGTLKEVRILREHHWLTPNEYDVYDLVSTGTGCTSCTGTFYWEKE